MAFLFTILVSTSSWTRFIKHSDLLSYVDSTGQQRAVHTLASRDIKGQQILDSMQAVMGQLPYRQHLPPMDIRIIDNHSLISFFLSMFIH